MASEVAIERLGQAGLHPSFPQEDQSLKRQPAIVAVLLWPVGIACIGFTMCYAYHIGI